MPDEAQVLLGGADVLPLEEADVVAWRLPRFRELKRLPEENLKLMRLVADLSLDKVMPQDLA